MKTIYGTYRMAYTNTGNRYSMSYFFENELEDYIKAGILSIQDTFITDESYISELAPGLKSKTRFFKASYDENFVPDSHFEIVKNKMVANHYATFFATKEEAMQWLRDQTNLVEEKDGQFVVQESDEESGTEKVLLEIF